MDTVLFLKAFFAFAFVVALMFLFSWFLKKAGLAGQSFTGNGQKRLKVVEYLPLDHRRRLVLVRRDDREHLLVLHANGETVVETNIIPPAAKVVEMPAKEQKNA